MRVLGVSAETLRQYGAVSAETAAEMARGVRRAAGADFGIGITGIAGPGGGTKEKPVGLVFLAAACENKVYVQRLLIENRTRDTVRGLFGQIRAGDAAAAGAFPAAAGVRGVRGQRARAYGRRRGAARRLTGTFKFSFGGRYYG